MYVLVVDEQGNPTPDSPAPLFHTFKDAVAAVLTIDEELESSDAFSLEAIAEIRDFARTGVLGNIAEWLGDYLDTVEYKIIPIRTLPERNTLGKLRDAVGAAQEAMQEGEYDA